MNNRLTIGEMSKLHQIPVKTLRYYDEIGLFQPMEVNAQTGYRYYSFDQFEQLHIIKYLKNMGVKLSEIKSHMEDRDLSDFIGLLKREQMEAKKAILHYQNLDKMLERRIQELEAAKQEERIGCPFIKEMPAKDVILLAKKMSSTEELETSLGELVQEARLDGTIIIGKVGLTVNRENVLAGHFHTYDSIFINMEQEYQGAFKERLKAGLYGCINYRGDDHKEAAIYYNKLLAHLATEGYQVMGDAIEQVVIDRYLTDKPAHFLTRIQIPIGKHNNQRNQ